MTSPSVRHHARRRTGALAPLCVYAVAVAVLLGPSLVGVTVALPHDLHVEHLPWRAVQEIEPPRNRELLDHVDTYYPVQHELLGRLRRGADATWLRDIGFGQLGVEFIGWGALSPFNLPALLLPFDLAWSWGQALRLLAAMAGAHVLVRSLGAGRAGATVAGLSFGLSGFMVGWLGWPQSHVAAFLPWVLWAVRATAAPARRRWGAPLLALLVAALWLGGFPAVASYALVAAGVVGLHALAACRPLGPRVLLARGAALAGGVATGTLLAAFTLAPSLGWLEAMDLSARGAALASRVPTMHLWTFLAPRLFGGGSTGPGWSGSAVVETTGYAGVVTTLLVVAAWVLRPRRTGVWLFSGLGAGAGLLAYGFPPIVAVVARVPGLDINPPARALVLVGLCLAVVGGLGADAALDWVAGRARVHRWAAAAVAVVAAALVAGVVATDAVGDLRAQAAEALEGDRLAAAAQGARAAIRGAVALTLAAVLVLGGARLAAWRAARGASTERPRPDAAAARWRAAAALALVGVVAVDMVVFAWGWNTQVPRDDLFPTGPGIAALQEASRRYRTAGADGATYANANLEYGIADLRLRGFLTERQREVLRAAGATFTSPTRWDLDVEAAQAWEPWLTAAAVRGVLAPSDGPPPPAGWEVEDHGPVRFLRNPFARQRVSAVPDAVRVPAGGAAASMAAAGAEALARTAFVEVEPSRDLPSGGTAEVLRWEADGSRVRAHVASDGGAVLVHADAAVPGWSATVDGDPVDVLTADHLFTGVVVPAGEHTVELRYRAPYALLGRAASLVGLGLLALLLWLARRAGHPPEGDRPPRSGPAST